MTVKKKLTKKKAGKIVEVFFSQDVKLSHEYQSMGTTAGMKAAIDTSKGESVKQTVAKLKRTVDEVLEVEVPDMKKALRALARQMR